MSDWFGTHSTAPAALAGPRPRDARALGVARAHAGRRRPRRPGRRVGGRRPGTPRPAAMGRVGILGGATTPDEQEEDDPGRRAVARRVAAEGTVLLVNDGLLPLDAGQRRHHRRHRPQRRPARHGGRQLRGDPAPAAAGGRGAGRAVPGCRRHLRGGVPDRPWASAHRPAAAQRRPAARPCASSTSTTRSSPALRSPRARRTPPGSCGSARRSRASPSGRARSASRRRSCPTCRARGGSGSRAPGGPSSSLTATSSSTTPSPSAARASTAPAASRSR